MKHRAGLAAVCLAMIATSAFAGPQEARECTAAKLKRLSSAYSCLIKQDRKAATGKTANPERCREKLIDAFAAIEAGGDCTLEGDAEAAWDYMLAGQGTLAPVIAAFAAAAQHPGNCASAALVVANTFSKCAVTDRIGDLKDGEMRDHFGVCSDALSDNLARLFSFSNTNRPCDGAMGELRYAIADAMLPYFNYLPSADFSGVRLEYVNFRGGLLTNADFSGAALYAVSFTDSDLTNAVFAGAGLHGVHFGATITGADLSTAVIDYYIDSVGMIGCPAALPADWYCMNGQLVGPYAELRDLDLSGMDLSGLDLSGAYFYNVNLSGADLSNADMRYARFTLGNATGANFQNATLGSATFSEANFDGSDFTGADLSGFVVMGFTKFSARDLVACPASLPPAYSCVANDIVGPRAY